MKASQKFFITTSLLTLGVSSAFAGFTGDTVPATPDDGNMHIMDSVDVANPDIMPISSEVTVEPILIAPAPSKIPTSLSGSTWKSISFNKKSFTGGTLGFSGGSINARVCNIIGGNYSEKNKQITAPSLFSTKMYCADVSGEAESKFDLNKAKYRFFRNGKTLRITTASGNVFFWEKTKK